MVNAPTNLTSALDIMLYANTETQGWFGTLILVMIFVVVFMGMKSRFTTSRCMAGACFLTAICAVLLRVLGLINEFPFLVSILMLILSVIYLRVDQEGL